MRCLREEQLIEEWFERSAVGAGQPARAVASHARQVLVHREEAQPRHIRIVPRFMHLVISTAVTTTLH